jgi:hypothetical protein
MAEGGFWKLERGDGPLVAVAVHHGHAIRDELASLLAIDEQARLREEDPFTGEWTAIAPVRCVVLRSRFEVDLNRPRDRAVYREPADAWELDVWKREPPDDIIARSLDEYDAFYDAMGELLADIERRYGRFVVFDIHSYNHRREGPDGPEADAAGNPQVNVGTGSLDRARWGGVVEGFMSRLRSHDFPGGELDVRENIKFRGGHFVRWVHETFPSTGCALAIEFKKFFMDEWTGEPDRDLVAAIGDGLRSTVPEVLEEMRRAL